MFRRPVGNYVFSVVRVILKRDGVLSLFITNSQTTRVSARITVEPYQSQEALAVEVSDVGGGHWPSERHVAVRNGDQFEVPHHSLAEVIIRSSPVFGGPPALGQTFTLHITIEENGALSSVNYTFEVTKEFDTHITHLLLGR